VLDIGCGDGALFADLTERLAGGVGIDPDLPANLPRAGVRWVRGEFPGSLPSGDRYAIVTALAVFEHVPVSGQPAFLAACRDRVAAGGRLILTVPSPMVDGILHVLRLARLIDGLALDQHHGYDVRQTVPLALEAGFKLEHHARFELGLNHLFVFRAPPATDAFQPN